MSIEELGKAIYDIIVQNNKEKLNINTYLKKRNLNILDCEESDIEYRDFEVDIMPTDSSIILDDTLEEMKFHLKDGKIFNLSNQIVGYYQNWCDPDVPSKYCDSEDNILDPITNKPIIEYYLEPKYANYHSLSTSRIYREYKYDFGLNRFIRTGDVKM